MKSILPLASLWVLVATPAMAQTVGTGTCEGTVGTAPMATIGGKTYVSVNKTPILSGAGYVFGLAECECKTRDIAMRIEMNPTIPQGVSGSGAEMWVGSVDCSTSSSRTQTGTVCEKNSASISVSQFMSTAPIDIPIASELVTNPKPIGMTSWPYTCKLDGTQSRTVFVLLGDISGTPATCKLPLSIDTAVPVEPTNVTASAGDSAITVRWDAPTGDNTQDIENYQILCRRKDQPTVPVKDSEYRTNNRYWFSVCLNGSMYRRPPPTLTDNSPIAPEDNIPAAVAGQFPIHPAFICSDRISAANTGSFSTRVDGLENNVDYEMLVIAIDKNGNPSASQTIVEGRPVPSVNPLSAVCTNNPDCPVGFGCSAAPGTVSRAPQSQAGLSWLLSAAGALGVVATLRRRRKPLGTPAATDRRSA